MFSVRTYLYPITTFRTWARPSSKHVHRSQLVAGRDRIMIRSVYFYRSWEWIEITVSRSLHSPLPFPFRP